MAKMCIKCGLTRASFNKKGLTAEYCKDCKNDDMIDVVHKKCVCGKSIPSFALAGEKAEYCAKCKKPDMVDVVTKRCRHKKRYCLACNLHETLHHRRIASAYYFANKDKNKL